MTNRHARWAGKNRTVQCSDRFRSDSYYGAALAAVLALFVFTDLSALTSAAGALAAAAPDLAIHLVAAAALSVGLTLKRGATLDSATPSDIILEDVSDRLTWRRPYDSPLYVLLRNLRKGEPAEATEIKWHEQSVHPRTTTKNGDSTSGSSDTSTTINVNDDIYQVDDILWLPENSTDSTAKLIVESTSSGSITVYRIDGGGTNSWGTVPAMSDGEKIVRLGKSKVEFFQRSPFRSTYPEEFSNYVQREDEVVGISRTKQATGDYAGDSWESQRDNQVWDFQTSRESMLFFGEKAVRETTGGSGNFEDGKRGFMGGVEYFGPGNTLSYSASSFSTGKLLDMVRRTFTGDNGSPTRYLFADSLMLQDIMQLDNDLKQRDYESQQLRRILPEIDMHFGNVRVIYEPLFDEYALSRQGYLLDLTNIDIRELNPMKTKRLELEEKDGMGVQVKEEMTVEWRYLDTHAKISGTA
jgi:hypothetical protein